jgi:DNA-binding winged helix-turn-helix (wHTH) protein/tetratricopeptide (TPR) repeat protein
MQESSSEKSTDTGSSYRFGLFVLDPAAGVLTRNGVRVKLQEQPFQLLLLLLENSGQLVSREEIQRRLWPANTFVEFDKSLGVAVLKVREALSDEANNPRFVETVPRRGYRFIAPVLIENPAESPQAVPAPAEYPPKQENAPPTQKEALQPVWPWAILALAVLVIGGVVYVLRTHQSHHPPPAAISEANAEPPVQVRRSVAVLGFRNLPGRPQEEWLSNAFAEMLNTELAAGGELRLVSGEDVARAKKELALGQEDSLGKASLDRLRTNPGADIVVLGSYTLMPANGKNRIRLDVRLQDTSAGETIAEEAFTGDEDSLFQLASEAGAHLRESLGLSMSTATAAGETRMALPTNQLAVRYYTEGRQKLWEFDTMAARDLLEKAVAADPNYSLAHEELSRTLDYLGYSKRSHLEAKRALDLSRQLPQEDMLLVQAHYAESVHDWPGAIRTYQSLSNMFPDSLDYGLRLATAQLQGQPGDSLHTLNVLRKLPVPLGNDPRIDMLEGTIWFNQDLVKARAAMERGIAKAKAQGASVLVARGFGFLCQEDVAAAVPAKQALKECQTARQYAIADGEKNGAARNENDMAGIYFEQGDLAQAAAMWREALQEFRHTGDVQGLAATENNLGAVILVQGDLKSAETLLKQSIPQYEAINDMDGVARALTDIGDVKLQGGNLPAAKASYQRAVGIASTYDDKSAAAYGLFGLGEVLTQQGYLAEARRFYREALEDRKQVGEKQNVAETQMDMARLSMEEGHTADVEDTIRQCKAQFHQDLQVDDELTASMLLSRALRIQGKQTEAQAEVNTAKPLSEKTQNHLLRLQYNLESAQVLLALKNPASSRSQLQEVLKDARTSGFVGLEFETMLALAQAEQKIGHAATARAQLASLKSSAHTKGFELIARKASSAN